MYLTGSCEEFVGASLHHSPLWRHVQPLVLKKNMHMEQSEESQTHAEWLLNVGQGRKLGEGGTIQFPSHMNCRESLDNLINALYPSIDIR